MSNVTRRSFLGTAGLAAGLGSLSAEAESPKRNKRKKTSMKPESTFRDLVDKTPLVDTHEHLWEESNRLKAKASGSGGPCSDFSVLFSHYADSDLQVAGMPAADFGKLMSPGLDPKDKWKLVAPYYARCRNTGYLKNVRESLRLLYDEEDIGAHNCEAVSRKIADAIRPGYYRRVLKDAANLEYSQVNSLDVPVFRETAQPDLLAQDISFVGLSTGLNVGGISKLANREVHSLSDWIGVIDWCFATYGPRAVAVKNQSAYGRRLNYAQVSQEDAAPLFERYLRDESSLSDAEHKAIQDCLFHYCVQKATEYHLPVKLHTGYYAGHNSMPLERLRQNAGDLCPVLQAHPDAKFVLMHIDYPYQDEVIALAKQWHNAYVDMCWAWIINPVAGVRFLKEFLLAAPACKVFTFGGDYLPVEMVPGHASIARQGIAQAFGELVAEGWITENEAPDLIERVMRGNAHDIYEYDRAMKNWRVG